MKEAFFVISISLLLLLASCGGGGGSGDSDNGGGANGTLPLSSREGLGQALFNDVNLSLNRTQSCATCHNPNRAFTDPRGNGVGGMASLGDDGISLGKRNAPTITYAMFSPVFGAQAPGDFIGGQFLDGRAADLRVQAGAPPIGPDEMNMPDRASVVARILENPMYESSFKALFGEGIFDDTDAAYLAMTEAIATFETTEEFASFDSKYDRFLEGRYEMTPQESLGRALFFSAQFTNCSECHQLGSFGGSANETFSNYEYHNVGTPRNDALLGANGNRTDRGLSENPQAASGANTGKFKVPTLRNVAVTGPYMHNGVFADLRTVILFYDKFNNPNRTINPETGAAWRDAEFSGNVNLEVLESAPSLSDEDVDALVAFLKTLTDRRFESLIP